MNKKLEDKSDIDVKAAVLTTFEYDEGFLKTLTDKKIPVTLFEDKLKRDHATILIPNDELNFTKINIHRHGRVPYASYHSKLILYEFDDCLRVIIASANLTEYSWNDIA